MSNTENKIQIFHIWISLRITPEGYNTLPVLYTHILLERGKLARGYGYPTIKLLADEGSMSEAQFTNLQSSLQDADGTPIVEVIKMRDYLRNSGVTYFVGDSDGSRMTAYDMYVNLYDDITRLKSFAAQASSGTDQETDAIRDALKIVRMRIANLIDFTRVIALRTGFTGLSNEKILYSDFDTQISFPIQFEHPKGSAISLYLDRGNIEENQSLLLDSRDFSIMFTKSSHVYGVSVMYSDLSTSNNFFKDLRISYEILLDNRLSAFMINSFIHPVREGLVSPLESLYFLRKHTLTFSDGIVEPRRSDTSWAIFSREVNNQEVLNLHPMDQTTTMLEKYEDYHHDNQRVITTGVAGSPAQDFTDQELRTMKDYFIKNSLLDFKRFREFTQLQRWVTNHFTSDVQDHNTVPEFIRDVRERIFYITKFAEKRIRFFSRLHNPGDFLDILVHKESLLIKEHISVLRTLCDEYDMGRVQSDVLRTTILVPEEITWSSEQFLFLRRSDFLEKIWSTYKQHLGLFISFKNAPFVYPVMNADFQSIKENIRTLYKDTLAEQHEMLRQTESSDFHEYTTYFEIYNFSASRRKWEKLLFKVQKYNATVYLINKSLAFNCNHMVSKRSATCKKYTDQDKIEIGKLLEAQQRLTETILEYRFSQEMPELSGLLDIAIPPIYRNHLTSFEDLSSFTPGQELATPEVLYAIQEGITAEFGKEVIKNQKFFYDIRQIYYEKLGYSDDTITRIENGDLNNSDTQAHESNFQQIEADVLVSTNALTAKMKGNTLQDIRTSLLQIKDNWNNSFKLSREHIKQHLLKEYYSKLAGDSNIDGKLNTLLQAFNAVDFEESKTDIVEVTDNGLEFLHNTETGREQNISNDFEPYQPDTQDIATTRKHTFSRRMTGIKLKYGDVFEWIDINSKNSRLPESMRDLILDEFSSLLLQPQESLQNSAFADDSNVDHIRKVENTIKNYDSKWQALQQKIQHADKVYKLSKPSSIDPKTIFQKVAEYSQSAVQIMGYFHNVQCLTTNPDSLSCIYNFATTQVAPILGSALGNKIHGKIESSIVKSFVKSKLNTDTVNRLFPDGVPDNISFATLDEVVKNDVRNQNRFLSQDVKARFQNNQINQVKIRNGNLDVINPFRDTTLPDVKNKIKTPNSISGGAKVSSVISKCVNFGPDVFLTYLSVKGRVDLLNQQRTSLSSNKLTDDEKEIIEIEKNFNIAGIITDILSLHPYIGMVLLLPSLALEDIQTGVVIDQLANQVCNEIIANCPNEKVRSQYHGLLSNPATNKLIKLIVIDRVRDYQRFYKNTAIRFNNQNTYDALLEGETPVVYVSGQKTKLNDQGQPVIVTKEKTCTKKSNFPTTEQIPVTTQECDYIELPTKEQVDFSKLFFQMDIFQPTIEVDEERTYSTIDTVKTYTNPLLTFMQFFADRDHGTIDPKSIAFTKARIVSSAPVVKVTEGQSLFDISVAKHYKSPIFNEDTILQNATIPTNDHNANELLMDNADSLSTVLNMISNKDLQADRDVFYEESQKCMGLLTRIPTQDFLRYKCKKMSSDINAPNVRKLMYKLDGTQHVNVHVNSVAVAYNRENIKSKQINQNDINVLVLNIDTCNLTHEKNANLLNVHYRRTEKTTFPVTFEVQKGTVFLDENTVNIESINIASGTGVLVLSDRSIRSDDSSRIQGVDKLIIDNKTDPNLTGQLIDLPSSIQQIFIHSSCNIRTVSQDIHFTVLGKPTFFEHDHVHIQIESNALSENNILHVGQNRNVFITTNGNKHNIVMTDSCTELPTIVDETSPTARRKITFSNGSKVYYSLSNPEQNYETSITFQDSTLPGVEFGFTQQGLSSNQTRRVVAYVTTNLNAEQMKRLERKLRSFVQQDHDVSVFTAQKNDQGEIFSQQLHYSDEGRRLNTKVEIIDLSNQINLILNIGCRSNEITMTRISGQENDLHLLYREDDTFKEKIIEHFFTHYHNLEYIKFSNRKFNSSKFYDQVIELPITDFTDNNHENMPGTHLNDTQKIRSRVVLEKNFWIKHFKELVKADFSIHEIARALNNVVKENIRHNKTELLNAPHQPGNRMIITPRIQDILPKRYFAKESQESQELIRLASNIEISMFNNIDKEGIISGHMLSGNDNTQNTILPLAKAVLQVIQDNSNESESKFAILSSWLDDIDNSYDFLDAFERATGISIFPENCNYKRNNDVFLERYWENILFSQSFIEKFVMNFPAVKKVLQVAVSKSRNLERKQNPEFSSFDSLMIFEKFHPKKCSQKLSRDLQNNITKSFKRKKAVAITRQIVEAYSQYDHKMILRSMPKKDKKLFAYKFISYIKEHGITQDPELEVNLEPLYMSFVANIQNGMGFERSIENVSIPDDISTNDRHLLHEKCHIYYNASISNIVATTTIVNPDNSTIMLSDRSTTMTTTTEQHEKPPINNRRKQRKKHRKHKNRSSENTMGTDGKSVNFVDMHALLISLYGMENNNRLLSSIPLLIPIYNRFFNMDDIYSCVKKFQTGMLSWLARQNDKTTNVEDFDSMPQQSTDLDTKSQDTMHNTQSSLELDNQSQQYIYKTGDTQDKNSRIIVTQDAIQTHYQKDSLERFIKHKKLQTESLVQLIQTNLESQGFICSSQDVDMTAQSLKCVHFGKQRVSEGSLRVNSVNELNAPGTYLSHSKAVGNPLILDSKSHISNTTEIASINENPQSDAFIYLPDQQAHCTRSVTETSNGKIRQEVSCHGTTNQLYIEKDIPSTDKDASKEITPDNNIVTDNDTHAIDFTKISHPFYDKTSSKVFVDTVQNAFSIESMTGIATSFAIHTTCRNIILKYLPQDISETKKDIIMHSIPPIISAILSGGDIGAVSFSTTQSIATILRKYPTIGNSVSQQLSNLLPNFLKSKLETLRSKIQGHISSLTPAILPNIVRSIIERMIWPTDDKRIPVGGSHINIIVECCANIISETLIFTGLESVTKIDTNSIFNFCRSKPVYTKTNNESTYKYQSCNNVKNNDQQIGCILEDNFPTTTKRKIDTNDVNHDVSYDDNPAFSMEITDVASMQPAILTNRVN
ncbi:MAG: hypothetical protein P857_886 [Candidatus Xenolissoclinum pacificiensis L6]|uniref:Uncharacterized protein n=1 Tax=Candidatus Xenolissoclinum pacificiensis L6 TaxID=1401685 RepID=W2V0G6_9RICK|nr:MAG: hypothetical protein P857_886 [Candidatus Xenolissoclinum pacificiensis L6]